MTPCCVIISAKTCRSQYKYTARTSLSPGTAAFRDEPIVIAATGSRIGELLAVRWRALDLEVGTLAACGPPSRGLPTLAHARVGKRGRRLEAPPGFEPGVEVLQSGPAISKLLSRLAFWSALILVLPRFRRVLFPSCSQVLGGGLLVGSSGNRTAI